VGTQAVQCGAVVCGLRSCVAWLECVEQSGIWVTCVYGGCGCYECV